MPNPRKPTKLKKIQGTYRPDRAQANEPQPEQARPTCPQILKGEARREWNRVTGELEEMGMLARIDRAALTAYCVQWDLFVKCCHIIEEKEALTFQTESGYSVIIPEISIRNQAQDRMQKIMNEFGMTPVARTKINVTPKEAKKENPFKSFGMG